MASPNKKIKPNKLQKLVEKGAEGRRLPVQSPKQLEFHYTEGQHRLRGNVNRATPPDTINLPDNSKPKATKPDWKKIIPKELSEPYKEPTRAADGSLKSKGNGIPKDGPAKTKPAAPKRSGSTSAKDIWDRSVRRPGTNQGPKVGQPANSNVKQATTKGGPKVTSSKPGLGSKVGRFASGVGGLATTFYFGDTFSSKTGNQANYGEKEALEKGLGPLMRGTKRKPAPGSNFTPGQGSASAHKKPGKLIYDRVAPEGGATRPTTLRPKPGNFTPQMPAATGAESVSSGPGTSYPNPGSSSKPKTGYPKPSSVGASSSGDSGFSSSSASPPAYSAPGGKSRVGGKVTSGVTMFFAGTGGRNHTRPETRYQRDSGLAMDSRKRK